jgi:hypothetical protein
LTGVWVKSTTIFGQINNATNLFWLTDRQSYIPKA